MTDDLMANLRASIERAKAARKEPVAAAAPVTRILITASRTWPDRGYISNRLNALYHEHGALHVIHGAAPGGDRMAAGWVVGRKAAGWLVDQTPWPISRADWTRYRNGAGPRRNGLMVADGAHRCEAFIRLCASPRCDRTDPHGTHGTQDCVDRAEAAGIPTTVHRWEDRNG